MTELRPVTPAPPQVTRSGEAGWRRSLVRGVPAPQPGWHRDHDKPVDTRDRGSRYCQPRPTEETIMINSSPATRTRNRTRRKRTAMASVTAGAAALVVLTGAVTAQAEEDNDQG